MWGALQDQATATSQIEEDVVAEVEDIKKYEQIGEDIHLSQDQSTATSPAKEVKPQHSTPVKSGEEVDEAKKTTKPGKQEKPAMTLSEFYDTLDGPKRIAAVRAGEGFLHGDAQSFDSETQKDGALKSFDPKEIHEFQRAANRTKQEGSQQQPDAKMQKAAAEIDFRNIDFGDILDGAQGDPASISGQSRGGGGRGA